MMPAPSSPAPAPSAPAIDACWKRIGIQGDKSCAELARHSHCRNCDRFAQAAVLLLDRDRPDEDVLPPPAAAPGGIGDLHHGAAESVMVFRLGAEWFALPTHVLDEIIPLRAIHSLPHRRHPALLGLVNVRGELVICLSLAHVLLGAGGAAEPVRLVVMRHEGRRLAFPVDDVQHARHHDRDRLQPVPVTLARSASAFTRGLLAWQGHQVGRLDEALVFAALERCLA